MFRTMVICPGSRLHTATLSGCVREFSSIGLDGGDVCPVRSCGGMRPLWPVCVPVTVLVSFWGLCIL